MTPNQIERRLKSIGFPLPDASAKLGVSQETVRVLLRAGKIEGRKVFDRWLVPLDEIRRVIRKRRINRSKGRRRYTFWPRPQSARHKATN
jgi:hypothetical protein